MHYSLITERYCSSNENQSILMISAYGSEPDDDLMVRQFIVKGAGFYNKLLKAIEMDVF